MIVCCGDSLIDFLPRETGGGQAAYQPFVGGGTHNTTIALGRLGIPIGFYGGVSTDFFGDMLIESFRRSHVSLDYVLRPDRPTTLAFVKLDNGQARYVFLDEATAGRMLAMSDLPDFAPAVTAIHTGSITLIGEPGASVFEELVKRESPRRVVSLDPNVRPGLIKDRAAYTARIRRMAAMADIVKLSDEDAAWLADGGAWEDVARGFVASGAKIVAVTRGSEGAAGFTASFETRAEPVRVKVADTVGAGDTFTAGLLASLHMAGLLAKPALTAIDKPSLDAALAYAAKAASITVSRPGADPPWAREMA